MNLTEREKELIVEALQSKQSESFWHGFPSDFELELEALIKKVKAI